MLQLCQCFSPAQRASATRPPRWLFIACWEAISISSFRCHCMCCLCRSICEWFGNVPLFHQHQQSGHSCELSLCSMLTPGTLPRTVGGLEGIRACPLVIRTLIVCKGVFVWSSTISPCSINTNRVTAATTPRALTRAVGGLKAI